MLFFRKILFVLLTIFASYSPSIQCEDTASTDNNEIQNLIQHVKKNRMFYTFIFLLAITAKLIYENKERPSDEDLSPAARALRWQEVIDCKDSIDQARLFIAYVHDFYIFGRRKKLVDSEEETVDENGKILRIKDKKLLITGYGIMDWLHTKIFDKLENSMKLGAMIVGALLAIDELRHNGKIPGTK